MHYYCCELPLKAPEEDDKVAATKASAKDISEVLAGLSNWTALKEEPRTALVKIFFCFRLHSHQIRHRTESQQCCAAARSHIINITGPTPSHVATESDPREM